jgi:hypothetical protein
MRDEGYRGFAGIDFIEYEPPPSARGQHLFIELNPRVNGALYPLSTRARLNQMQERRGRPAINAFVSSSLRTQPISFEALAASIRDRLFDPDRGSGILPYKTGAFEFGFVTALALAASPEEAEQLLLAFTSRLPARRALE